MMSSNLKNDGLVCLQNQNDGLDRNGLAMVVDDNCEFIFEQIVPVIHELCPHQAKSDC